MHLSRLQTATELFSVFEIIIGGASCIALIVLAVIIISRAEEEFLAAAILLTVSSAVLITITFLSVVFGFVLYSGASTCNTFKCKLWMGFNIFCIGVKAIILVTIYYLSEIWIIPLAVWLIVRVNFLIVVIQLISEIRKDNVQESNAQKNIVDGGEWNVKFTMEETTTDLSMTPGADLYPSAPNYFGLTLVKDYI